MPLISVVMPVYNSEDYLGEAIKSVLNQSFEDFVFYIVNDGSKDNSENEILKFRDSRINYKSLGINTGYVNVLNSVLSEVRTKYVVRLDSDDVCRKDRFEKQVLFLEANPQIGLCGSNAMLISDDSKMNNVIWLQPESHGAIIYKALFENPVIHPSVMFRSDLLEKVGNYNSDLMPSEDLDLWLRMSEITILYNLQEPLIRYRLHENQVSKTLNHHQQFIADKTHLNFIMNKLGYSEPKALSILNFLRGKGGLSFAQKMDVCLKNLSVKLPKETKKLLFKKLFRSKYSAL